VTIRTFILLGVLFCLANLSFAAPEIKSPIEARDLVLEELLAGDTAGKRLMVHPDLLSKDTQVMGWHETTITTPSEGFVVFIDDMAFANFTHPCRYVFVDSQNGTFLVKDATTPPRGMESWLEMKTEAFEKLMAAPNVRAPRAAVKSPPRTTPRGGEYYAVLMNGGHSSGSNHVRYWNDLSNIYITLVDVYNYKDENIIVLCSDGLNPAPDQSNGLNSDPDLDGDGDDDIMYSCVLSNVQSVFSDLASLLTVDDQLFIFATDHGSSVSGWDTDMNLWNMEVLHDWQFQDLIDALPPLNIIVTLEPCYSGGFEDNTTHLPPRVFSSACAYNEVSWAMPPDYVYDTYVFFWTAAVKGEDAYGVPCDADLNSDMIISMNEAFIFAEAHDISDETPQYDSNPATLGDNLFLGPGPTLFITFPSGLPEEPLPPGPETPLLVKIEDGLEQYVAGSGKFHYRVDPDDPYTEIALTDLGNNLFEAVMPGCVPGDLPEYYFSAEGDGGTLLHSPFNAPDEVYSLDICFVELLLEEDFEQAGTWAVESHNLQTGEWEWADPSGTEAQPEDDHTPNGTRCYVTGASGGSIGDNDVDGGPTMLTSTAVNLAGGDAQMSFYLYNYHTDYGTQQPLEIHLSNDGSTWKKIMTVNHKPSWHLQSFKVGDHITPTANVQMRLIACDNPNDDIVEALIDDLKVERYNFDPELWADSYEIPVSTGAAMDFTLDAGASYALRTYLLLGSMSGTEPGYILPGGEVLPLNWDVFTDVLLLLLGSPWCSNFMGDLDADGKATAALNTGSLDPSLIGLTAHFAFLLGMPYDLTSNAIPVTFEP
jgi:hypothetical protein